MKVVYTAGKYSGDITHNIKVATYFARELWAKGYAVICPHTNSAHFDETKYGGNPDLGYELFMRGYIEIVAKVDAVFLLPGWERSAGARREVAAAILQNKDIISPETEGIPIPAGFIRYPEEKPTKKYLGGAEK